MTHAAFTGNQIWCPNCQDYKKFLKTHNAATLADVTRRTIYRYIEEGTKSTPSKLRAKHIECVAVAS